MKTHPMNYIKSIIVLALILTLSSCGSNSPYNIGVFNNTKHTPVKIKIQYPSPDGMKRIRFSMITIGEFKSNQLNTRTNPIPPEAKISWENSEGDINSSVLSLSFVPENINDGAIIFDIDENDVSVKFLDNEEFSGEWEKRLIRKGYK